VQQVKSALIMLIYDMLTEYLLRVVPRAVEIGTICFLARWRNLVIVRIGSLLSLFSFFCVGLFDFLLLIVVASTSAGDCLERLVPKMTCNVLSRM